jgi:predicted protein tyrosine phosphatase
MNPPQKLLFICSRNQWRSPTAEKFLHGFNGYHVKSAGTEARARIKVTAGHLGWADAIFVMEPKHARRLREKFSEALAEKPVTCLHIPDDYKFMDPELIGLLKANLRAHLTVPE